MTRDNAMAESFFASLETELLDRHTWRTRDQLANAIFEWINAWYNPRRRHSALGYLQPDTVRTDPSDPCPPGRLTSNHSCPANRGNFNIPGSQFRFRPGQL